MAPKKNTNNKKKDTKRKELSEEDMLRLGMTPEDIQRIMEERGKSSEDKQAEQAREEANRRDAEIRQRNQREFQKQVEELTAAEITASAAIRYDEDSEWTTMESKELAPEKQKILRQVAVAEDRRRAEEARQRQAQELAAYQAKLQSMTEAERAAFLQEEVEKEQRRGEEFAAAEEKRLAREQRREARRLARKERMLNHQNVDDLLSSDDDDDAGGAKAAKRRGKDATIEELEFNLHEKYF